MDFVEGLPKSQGFDNVWRVVDRLTKYADFTPITHHFSTKIVTQLFVKQILRLHGIPPSIVSNRGSVFTILFLQELLKVVQEI